MSTVEREPATLFVHDWSADKVVNGAVYGLFGIHLVLVVLGDATGSVLAWQLAASSILLGAILGCRLAAGAYDDIENLQTAFLAILGFTFVVLGVVYQSSSPGLGLGPNRSIAVTAVFVLILGFLLVVTDARRYTFVQWGAVVCFGIFVGIYLANSLAFVPSSTQSRWPLWAAVVMGSNLFVIPRLVPERVFLWFLPRLAAVTVVLGLLTYAVGDYAVWIFEVRQYPGPTPGLGPFEPNVSTIQSIFANPNTFGTLAFAGLVAACVEFHRSVVARRPIGTSIGVLLIGLCGLGTFLSNARAAMLAAGVAIGIYAVYAVGGRLTIPVSVVASILGVAGLLAAMYVGVIGISATNRFELWSAALGAIRDGPLLFGYGNGSTSAVIEPYHTNEQAYSPHNSYLSVLIQTGLVGGLAYVSLMVGSVLAGIVDFRNVNVAMLAFTVGWGIHQLFESYTLFGWATSAVLGSLALGYLLFGE